MKKLWLILVILIAAIILTGCYCCGGYVTPPVQSQCSLTVVANSSRVWGWIVIDGNPTGEYIYPYQSITIYGVPCNQTVIVYIVDDCGAVSHKEYIYIASGRTNYAYFNYWDYWDDYWYKNSDSKKEQNDCHCKS